MASAWPTPGPKFRKFRWAMRCTSTEARLGVVPVVAAAGGCCGGIYYVFYTLGRRGDASWQALESLVMGVGVLCSGAAAIMSST